MVRNLRWTAEARLEVAVGRDDAALAEDLEQEGLIASWEMTPDELWRFKHPQQVAVGRAWRAMRRCWTRQRNHMGAAGLELVGASAAEGTAMSMKMRRPMPPRAVVIPRPRPRGAPRQPVAPPVRAGIAELQKGWWVVGILLTGIGTLGFQTLPPARRLAAVEAAATRLDSVDQTLQVRNGEQDAALREHQVTERAVLDSISRQLGQLLAGQCVKERDRMARLLYDCARRAP